MVALLAAVAVVAALLPAADASALPPHADEPRPAPNSATLDDTSAPPQALAQATHAQPTSIPPPTPTAAFNAVTAGGHHTCGLKTDNTITCWGHNLWGQTDAPSGTFNAVTAGYAHACGLKTNATITCWGLFAMRTAEPGGTFGPVGGSGPTVTVTKGGPGPTELGPGQGVPCGANTPTCRYLDVELSGFAAETYTVSCSHDGWENEAPLTWATFSQAAGYARSVWRWRSSQPSRTATARGS